MNATDHSAHWDAVEEAVELLHDGQVDEALPLLRAALERDPGNVYAHFHLGTALAAQGKPGPALAALAEAVRREPSYLGAVVARGWCLHELGRFEEAVQAGAAALALQADDPDALHLMALSHAELRQPREAIACLQRYLKSNLTVEARYEADALLKALRGEATAMDEA
jgi:tetratricopeptide (TPR) repeat protein